MSKNPNLDVVVLELTNELQAKHPMHFTVGHDEIDTIYVYEHRKGYAKKRLNAYKGYKVVSKYMGKIVP